MDRREALMSQCLIRRSWVHALMPNRTGDFTMNSLAIFMRILAGTAIAFSLVSAVAVLMRGSKK